MKEELWEILRDLEMGKISVNYANDRILRLFGAVGRSEQLLQAYKEGFDAAVETLVGANKVVQQKSLQ